MADDGQDEGAPSSEDKTVGEGDPLTPKSLKELIWPTLLLCPPLRTLSLRSAWPLNGDFSNDTAPGVAVEVDGGRNKRRPPSLKPRTMSPVPGSRKDAQ